MIRNLFCLLIIVSLSVSCSSPVRNDSITAKVYPVKYKRAEDIARLVFDHNLKADAGGQIQLVPGSPDMLLNTVTISAGPEGHAVVADILKKYDVPNKTIEFQFFLIKAKTAGEELKDKLPEKVEKALKEVASLVRYKSFEIIDAPYVRTKEGSVASLAGEGIYNYKIMILPEPRANLEGSQLNFGFQIYFFAPQVSPDDKSSAKSIAELTAPVSIKEGEVIALGASQIGRGEKTSGTAIITIVTAKIIP